MNIELDHPRIMVSKFICIPGPPDLSKKTSRNMTHFSVPLLIFDEASSVSPQSRMKLWPFGLPSITSHSQKTLSQKNRFECACFASNISKHVFPPQQFHWRSPFCSLLMCFLGPSPTPTPRQDIFPGLERIWSDRLRSSAHRIFVRPRHSRGRKEKIPSSKLT